jgi:hypothetical protein
MMGLHRINVFFDFDDSIMEKTLVLVWWFIHVFQNFCGNKRDQLLMEIKVTLVLKRGWTS